MENKNLHHVTKGAQYEHESNNNDETGQKETSRLEEYRLGRVLAVILRIHRDHDSDLGILPDHDRQKPDRR